MTFFYNIMFSLSKLHACKHLKPSTRTGRTHKQTSYLTSFENPVFHSNFDYNSKVAWGDVELLRYPLTWTVVKIFRQTHKDIGFGTETI